MALLAGPWWLHPRHLWRSACGLDDLAEIAANLLAHPDHVSWRRVRNCVCRVLGLSLQTGARSRLLEKCLHDGNASAGASLNSRRRNIDHRFGAELVDDRA